MRQITEAQSLEQCSCAKVDAAFQFLQGGMAQHDIDIDSVYINGHGWPV